MPLRHKSAQKQARQAVKRTVRNKLYKAKIRTAIKKVLDTKSKEAAHRELKNAVTLLDRVAARGIIHKNSAANQKSRLTRYVNSLT
jgi:small subunit ribosomal protein S20